MCIRSRSARGSAGFDERCVEAHLSPLIDSPWMASPESAPGTVACSDLKRSKTRQTNEMNRIDHRFAELKSAGRTGLIPFVTAGDPLPEAVVPLMHALVEAGADLIELGMPFSDPMADGPVIQHSSERALARGIGLQHVLDWVAG